MVEVPDVTLKNMLEQALAAYAAMSPVERAIHDDAQRRSFLRGQTGRDPGENPLVTEIMQLRTELAAALTEGRRQGLEEAAQFVDCGCAERAAVLAATTSAGQQRSCGRIPCAAAEAAGIRALIKEPKA